MSLNKENQILERIPPHSLEAEESLLGCLLIDRDAIIKVADTILPQDFYKEAHQTIFETVKELYGNQESIDIITVSNRLEEKKQLATIGGRSSLARLSNAVATSANVTNYADIIQRKATLRRLQQAASEIMTLSYNEESDIDDVLDETEKKIFAVSRKYLKNAFLPIDSLLSEAFERIDDLHKRAGTGLRGLATGFSDLDNLLAGLQKSDLIILAARPSVGKTSLALDIARQAAIKNKVGVGIFSLEMSKDQLVDRMLCSQAGVNLWKMRTGNLSDSGENNDFEKIADAMGKLAEAQIYIDDSGSLSIMEIRAKCRRLQMEKGLGLIIIDYLQLMEGNGRYGDNRVQEIAEISRGLKSIARELNIPVLALAQLSRAVEAMSPAIPKLSHLRDSGSIEQDADIVMFIYRKAADRSYNPADLPADERYKAEIHVAKHRNGPVGKVDLYFEEATASFHSLSRASEQSS